MPVITTCYCPFCHRVLTNYHTGQINGRTVCTSCYEDLATWLARSHRFTENTYTLGSKRKFGIEIETATCPNYRDLYGNTLWGAKYDCSISGMEFVSPILEGDDGLHTVDQLCGFARLNHWKIDDDCGLHIHLDMRDEKRAALKSIAYAYVVTSDLWATFVEPYRADNYSMCCRTSLTRERLEDARRFTYLARSINRFEWFNIAAYARHGTIEIRLHEGSLNIRAIRYWVMAHLRFVDAVKDKTFDEIDTMFKDNAWATLRRCWGSPLLARYYGRKRARRLVAA